MAAKVGPHGPTAMTSAAFAGLPGMRETTVLLDGLVFPESPRCRDGRVYVSDWGRHEVVAVDAEGHRSVAASGSAFPMCIDFLPDGRLLVMDGTLLRVQDGDRLSVYADLGSISARSFNDLTTDRGGTVYVNNVGFDFPGGEPRPGLIAVVPPEGGARVVAGDMLFPNGMVVMGERTLVVAESYGSRLTAFTIESDGSLTGRRVWAELDGGAPDGLCLGEEGAIWYADVPHQECALVAEGGAVLQRVPLDRGAFSCAYADGVLYVATNRWGGPESIGQQGPSGQLVAVRVS